MNFPDDRKYHAEHLWAQSQPDGTCLIGITDFAQDQLGGVIFVDLPAVGERLLKPIEFYDGSNILTVFSQVPAKGSDVDPDVESCESVTVDGERQYRTLINIMDGKRPTVQIVDMNGDGLYNAITDQGVSRAAVSKGSHNLITKGNRIIDIDTKNKQEILARMPEQSLRPSWRQVK